jgi:hypothetical protein
MTVQAGSRLTAPQIRTEENFHGQQAAYLSQPSGSHLQLSYELDG